MSYTSTFSVRMSCQDCANSITAALQSDPRVENVSCDVDKDIVKVTSSAPPSRLVQLIQSTGRDAIIRGSGAPDSAAVCIIESHDPQHIKSPIRGLIRMITLSTTSLLFDVSLSQLRPNCTYYPTIRSSGDISRGALSTGAALHTLSPILTDASGTAQIYQTMPHLTVASLIGRSIALSTDPSGNVDASSPVGVIARSAGIWQNEKTVCSCSGKTLWEERRDAVSQGIRL
ncbi:hypothetical protein CANCADRAFT_57918 [Tortispora caseinolytica NRRL Y-17796]|uniref:Superoxide dismutase 1 copper chaperone n=1 Tax=Tortispora caseinolytica NRRL Y-17796 TaxID=767744 RepID=A0A1E4TAM0_9ASCO|nr:hypothetical protein CANCADRAFT_57918 [Tortispora caseinolytica NRRL Y-17796]